MDAQTPETELDFKKNKELYRPTKNEIKARNRVLKDFIISRSIQKKSYNQFNGLNLIECIDDWTKRWNGYIPPSSQLLDDYQSRIFLNFTRNQVISYLSKVAMQKPKAKIKAVNKKTGMSDQLWSDVLEDLNRYSLDEENGEARFMEAAQECTVKGTVIVYEGYRKEHQKVKVPQGFDAESGQMRYKEEWKTIFDNCYQAVRPLEDFYISNIYQPDIQKQPWIVDRTVTTEFEGKAEFGHYPNWKYVQPGNYSVAIDPTTFYRNKLVSDLQPDQCEVIRYYSRKDNVHIILVNGVVLYDGPIPRKDGRYPYAKGIYEPYEVPFFYGMGFPHKIMGEQDLQNIFINMMADKTFGSLLPYGLSSDLDDLIEDDVLQPNKIRKVGDINKWKFDTLPSVNASEQGMLNTILGLGKENAGDMGGVAGPGPLKGGKVTARQLLLRQQESMQKLGFSMGFLEDMEVDRTTLRINSIVQFYSIPKIEKITGRDGKEVEQMMYRDIRVDETKLDDGRIGTRIVKIVSPEVVQNPDAKLALKNEMGIAEAIGDEKGTPTEFLAVVADTFYDYNFSVQVVKNSSYEQNEALEQAKRHELADWRLGLMAKFQYPVNMKELVDWVQEPYGLDTERFDVEQQPGVPGAGQPGQPPAPGQPEQPPQQPTGLAGATNASGIVQPEKVGMAATPMGNLT